MRCKEIMKGTVECVGPNDTVSAAAARMRDANIGFLPVCDDDRKVLGAITDRDIAVRVVAANKPLATTVAEIMTTEIVAVQPDDELSKAQQLMGEEHKSRLLCLDDEGRIAGVISLSDIARHAEGATAAKTMRDVARREARVP